MHRISLDDDQYEESHEFLTIDVPGESIGALFLTPNPDIVIVCAKYGVAKADFTTMESEYILKYPSNETQALRTRSNDGIIDPWGNIWIGTMTDFPITQKEGVSAEGTLYRVDAKDLSVKEMITGAQISNGLAFNEYGTKFYWTDSLTFTVWQFDYDNEKLELSNRQALVDMRDVFPEENSPEPDGLSRSKDGVFYHAVFGTSTVVAYDSDGQVKHKFKFPAQRLTSTALGGKDDDTMFVTSAHLQLDNFDATIDAKDRAGDLGGFLYAVKLPQKVNSKPKALWKGE